MLHIVPSKRPTAAQILRHPWIWQTPTTSTKVQPHLTAQPYHQQSQEATNIKGAVNATFRAISSPQAAHLGPVGMSALARRRGVDKANN